MHRDPAAEAALLAQLQQAVYSFDNLLERILAAQEVMLLLEPLNRDQQLQIVGDRT